MTAWGCWSGVWGGARVGCSQCTGRAPEVPCRGLDFTLLVMRGPGGTLQPVHGNLLRVNRKCGLGGAVGSHEESWGSGSPAERKGAHSFPDVEFSLS